MLQFDAEYTVVVYYILVLSSESCCMLYLRDLAVIHERKAVLM